MSKFKPTIGEIENALTEKFKIPFIYDTPDNKYDLNGYHFFTYTFENITWDQSCIWKQEMIIAYVSNQEEDLKEREIWETLRSTGLKIEDNIEYGRAYLADKSVTVDIVYFRCYRGANFIG